jgi:hypothetical protein
MPARAKTGSDASSENLSFKENLFSKRICILLERQGDLERES